MKRLHVPTIVLVGALTFPPCFAASLCIGPRPSGEPGYAFGCDQLEPPLYPVAWFGFSESEGEACSDCPEPIGGGLCDREYTFSISASSTDPMVNVAALPSDNRLYLWLVENRSDQLCGSRFGLDGSLGLVTVEPSSGVLWADWALPDLWFAMATLDAPYMVAGLVVGTAVSTEAGSWGRMKALYR